jgi:hypothetical protein
MQNRGPKVYVLYSKNALIFCTGIGHLSQYYPANQINMIEMGGACGTCEVKDRFVQGFGWKAEGRGHWEDLDVDGKILDGS